MRSIVAQVPNGFQADNIWIRQANIRELNGYDEQLIISSQNYFSPFKTSILLERVVTFYNLPKSNMHEIIRNLTAGDRIALILHLRKITFGDTLHCMVQCPECKNNLTIDLLINNLLQPVNPNPKINYHIKLEKYNLKIRPITGADLENIALNKNAQNLTEKLLRNCITSSDPPLPKTLNIKLQKQLNTKLSEIDKQADTVLNINCPSCNKNFKTPLDVEDFFFQEVTSLYQQLEWEIHWIALHYHWDEQTILSLSLSKRKRYVELINTTVSGENV